MATSDVLSTPTVAAALAGLLVAGLGAAYAYTQLGGATKHADTLVDTHADTHRPVRVRVPKHATRQGGADGDVDVRKDGSGTSGAMRKGRKKKGKDKDKGAGMGTGEGEGKGEGKDKGVDEAAVAVPFPRIVPGDFEGVGVGAGASVVTDVGAVAPVGPPKGRNSDKTKTSRKKKKQGKGKSKDGNEENEGIKVGGDPETGREVGVDVGSTAVHGPRSGDSTDSSVSLSPSVSASAVASSRAVGKGSLRASTRLAPLSQPHAQASAHAHTPSHPHGIRPSLSFDTDSSWMHVGHRRVATSRSVDGQAQGIADAMDMTSSDLTSTASESPVAERTNGITTDMHGARADLVQRTLAEKLTPRPRKTGVDDMLELPDFPALARVMRVQPRMGETPVPGFSWEDYGDVVEESVLVDDADQEDEGGWGVVKSRNRARPAQTATMMETTTSTVTVHDPAASATMTKKQRQNARKRALAKSAKAEVEAARQKGLAKHKRELEQLRIIDQSRRSGGKQPSGGMQATVDDRGKLVWE